MNNLKILVEEKIVTTRVMEINLDLSTVNPEVVKAALTLKKDNVEEFLEKWNINLKHNTNNIMQEEAKKVSKIKILATSKERKLLNAEIEDIILSGNLIGYITISATGSGSNRKYQASKISGYHKFVVEKDILLELLQAQNYCKENTTEEGAINIYKGLNVLDKKSISEKYLMTYYDAPKSSEYSDGVSDYKYSDDGEGESVMLYWLSNCNGIKIEDEDTDIKYPSIYLEWELTDIEFTI